MSDNSLSFECSFPIENYPFITMAHGAGGRLTQILLESVFRPAFDNPLLNQQHDGALLTLPTKNIAISTDSYVVYPLFFPGSNIGELAITGTINDLAMCGARPLYITCAFILTEGLSTQILIQVVNAIRRTALENQVQIVAGDIKVVEKTSEESLYINTTGIGILSQNEAICPQNIQNGDAIIVSGDIGRHGLAVLSQRGNFNFEPPIESDCAPLWPMVSNFLEKDIIPHCLRDLTRGGLAGALIELANTSKLCFEIIEKSVPIIQGVHAASEILGLDPLYIANEGRMIIFTSQNLVSQTLDALHQFPEGQLAACIGVVQSNDQLSGQVILKTPFGSKRKLNLFSGEQLPRIC
jgi:hydrogenase expression/formation protein HypE